jgi:hypothetical protein
MKSRNLLLVPFCLALTGCAEELAKLHLDENGKPCAENQEFAYFIINSFNLVFDHPLMFLASIVGVFLLMSFGVALWAKGGIWKFFGVLMVVAGAAIYCVFLGMVYLVMALALGVIISGFRKH